MVSSTRVILGNVRCQNNHVLTVLPSVQLNNGDWVCSGCRCRGSERLAMNPESGNYPVFHCSLCHYDLCFKCASLATFGMSESPAIKGVLSSQCSVNINGDPMHPGQGCSMFYCGKQYAEKGGCLCGHCDGKCGPRNGDPCPDCLVSFELVALSKQMRCKKGHLLSITHYKGLPSEGVKCQKCGSPHMYMGRELWSYGMYCGECGINESFVCAHCASL